MKSIFDSSFKYKPSFDTDLRQTFFRIRQEQQAQIRGEEHAEVPKDRQASEDSSSAARY
jgi:hypothetical protein